MIESSEESKTEGHLQEVTEVPVHNVQGEVVDHIQLRRDIFGVPFNEGVVHRVLVVQLANARHGTASTKTRSEVRGGGAKPFRQKGTGRARQGSIRAPHFRHGGVAFGPHPRDYSQDIPRKARRLAIRSALSAKVAEGNMFLVDRFGLIRPQTTEMVRILHLWGERSSTLILTSEDDSHVVLSVRNIPGAKTIPAESLNVVDLVHHRKLLMSVSAVRKLEETLAKGLD